MTRTQHWFAAVICSFSLAASIVQAQGSEPQALDEQAQIQAWIQQFEASLDRQTGTISLPNGVATLNVPEGFYYLSPQDSQRVLVEAWGNPESDPPLGMLFPAEKSPLDSDSWGVTIEYSDEGYVSDEDANEIDYSDLLADMKASTRQESEQRVRHGYEAIELVDWAAQPYYDSVEHKLHWAQELRFGDAEENTLNYNIRVLGRNGYLLMNFIADMNQLPEINQNVDSVLAMAQFNEGHRYDQFDPEYDKYAAYGIGGLVAGKVMAKTGLLAGALLFLKKFGVFIVVGLGALVGKAFKRSA
ncbi:MAG: hypothetical protein CMK89_12675 [Pseudomonadales bacterium]|nr:hypothetical protein [Pseudomonadales bacterium]